MARARNIKPSLFKNELLGTSDPLLTILFEGLWCLADREGRLEDRPLRINAEVFPYRGFTLEQINGYLTELLSLGFICRYEVDGIGVIQVLKFCKHQSPHRTEKESELPPKPMETQVVTEITVKAPLSNGKITEQERSDSLLLIPDSFNAASPRDRDLTLNEWFDAIAPVMGAKTRFGLTRQAAWKSVCEICIREGYRPADLIGSLSTVLTAPNFQMKYFTPEKVLDELRIKRAKPKADKLPTIDEKFADDLANSAAMKAPPKAMTVEAVQ